MVSPNAPEVSTQNAEPVLMPEPVLMHELVLTTLRNEIQVEHSLISNRLTWYVASQSFLMTAYAICWGDKHNGREFFSSAIPVLGSVLSLCTLIGVIAAVWSQFNLNQTQDEDLCNIIHPPKKPDPSPEQKSPEQISAEQTAEQKSAERYRKATCTGKDSGPLIHFLGMIPPLTIPFVFLVLWIVSLRVQPLTPKGYQYLIDVLAAIFGALGLSLIGWGLWMCKMHKKNAIAKFAQKSNMKLIISIIVAFLFVPSIVLYFLFRSKEIVPDKEDPQKVEWVYKIIPQDQLDKSGKDGWEVIAVTGGQAYIESSDVKIMNAVPLTVTTTNTVSLSPTVYHLKHQK